MTSRFFAVGFAVTALLMLGGGHKKEDAKKPAAEDAAKKDAATFQSEPAGAQPNPERNAYFGEKLKPLLNAEQQQKFQTLRESFRQRLIEEMAEKAVQKVRSAVTQWFTEKSSK